MLGMRLGAALLVVALAAAQECSETNVRARGAAGDGQQDDTGAFNSMEGDITAGLIYMSAGTYRISQSLTISKPIMAADGAVFQVDAGCTLTLVNQPEHPLTTFFTGDGSVQFTDGTIRAYPEWWGARGDGVTDDSVAIQNAFNAAAVTSNAMLYLTGTYGIGSELRFSNKATVFAQPTAKFVSVNGNSAGVTFLEGGFGYKIVMPHLSGFSDFCVRLLGSDLAMMQLQTLSDCGDAIRLESTPGNDVSTIFDDTIWFDKIQNSRVGVIFKADDACAGSSCIMQGSQIVGNAIIGGPSTGEASAFAIITPGGQGVAWDANQFDVAIVTPPASNPDYVVYRVSPQSDREVLKIARLDPLPPGSKIFNSNSNNMLIITINLAQQLGEGQLGLAGLMNLITIKGATTPLPGSPPVSCVNQQGNKAGFNGGRSLVGNIHQLLAIPDTDWAAGEVKQFFAYHQLATGNLWQIKCGSPAGPNGNPTVDCVQYNDNSQGNPGVPATADELQLYLINLTGQRIPAKTQVPFSIAVGTLDNP